MSRKYVFPEGFWRREGGGVQLQDSCWRSADTADRNKQRSPTGASRTGEVNSPLKVDRGHLTSYMGQCRFELYHVCIFFDPALFVSR